MAETSGCGAPEQGLPLDPSISTAETVIQGVVTANEDPVGSAYVRLLDRSGEFTAEVVSSPNGQFRFFAAPGNWTLRALSPQGNGETVVAAEQGVNNTKVTVGV